MNNTNYQKYTTPCSGPTTSIAKGCGKLFQFTFSMIPIHLAKSGTEQISDIKRQTNYSSTFMLISRYIVKRIFNTQFWLSPDWRDM